MKQHLAAPGPTPLPPEVMEALQRPIVHHRSPVFSGVMAEIREGLKKVFGTKEEVLVLASSGTGAMEAAIANLTSPRDPIIVVEAGKFGERFTEIGKAYGLEVIADKYPYGEGADPARVEQLLQAHPQVKLVCVQACETSTGVVHPIKELAAIVRRKTETALVVDGITGVGIFDLPMDAWGIDVLIGGSQKAFMIPPGLGFIALSEKGWRLQALSHQPRYYWDLKKHQKSMLKNDNAFTPAINLLVALQTALKMMTAEGLANVLARHGRLAQATREAVSALGLALFPKGRCADGLTAVLAPQGIDASSIVKEMRQTHGVTIAGGQGEEMKKKIFRLAHMGYMDFSDLVVILSALEQTLLSLGMHSFAPGAGIAAAQRSWSKRP